MRINREYLLENHADLVDAFRAEGAAGVSLPEINAEYLEANHPAVVTAITQSRVSSAVDAERARIKGIRDLTIAGHEDLAQTAVDDGSTPEQFAVAQVKAEKQSGTAALDRIRAAEAEQDAPPPSAPKDDAVEEESAEAKGTRLFAMSPRGRRKQAASG